MLPMPSEPSDSTMMLELGRAISERRKEQGLTLVKLAALTDLSQPFLSQIERGRARPSMASLHRIARALATATPVLMSSAGGVSNIETQAEIDSEQVSLVRANEGAMATQADGQAKALVAGARGMYPMEFVTRLADFEEYYEHPQPEFIYVISGSIEVDLADSGMHVLEAADTLYFAGGVRHRWRVRGLWPARVLVTQGGDLPAPHEDMP